MKAGLKITLACVLIGLLFSKCNKDIDGKLPEGQVALTFDDYNVDNWYQYLPLLDSLGIHATFYICRYHTLTTQQKEKLRIIAQHGHEIAYHTTNHPDLARMLQREGMPAVINEEIKKDLHMMRQDGFQIKNFAYPFGSSNMQLDGAIKRYFQTVRKVCNAGNWLKSLVKQSGNDKKILYGAGIDDNSALNINGILFLLDNAYSHHDCVVLTAHEINTHNTAFSVSLIRLHMIIGEARKRNLKFVRVDEITE